MSIIEIHADTKLMWNPDVILREDEPGGPMLFNPDSNDMRILNESGLLIFKQCQRGITFHNLKARLLDAYDSETEQELENDLLQFLREMIGRGFIGILS